MAISTYSYQNIEYNGNTISQIGLSKTLDNYTWDEIFDYQYCSMCNGLARIIMPYKADTNYEDYNDDTKQGFTVTNVDDDTGLCDIECKQAGVYQYPQGLYCKIIWLQGTRSESRTYQVYNSNMANFKLVTEWDAPNFIFTLPDPQSTFGSCATAWTDSEESVKTTWFTDRAYGSLAYRYRHDSTHSDISISGNVMPYMLYKLNGHFYCQQLRQTTYSADGTIDKSGTDAKTGINDKIYPVEDGQPNSLCFFGGNISAEGLYTTTDRTGTHDNPAEIYYKYTSIHNLYCNLDNSDCMGRFRYGGSSPSSYVCLQSFFRTKHSSLLFWAGCGVKFYADKLYKPIIDNGFVTDFSDDMTTPSELDNWSGDSNHTVPDAPPSPAPSGDDEDNNDPIATTGAPFASGLCNYYALTAGSVLLEHISEAMGTWDIDTTKKDLYRNLISCKLIKPPAPIPTSGSAPFTIYGVKPQYQGADISLPVINGNPDNTFGPYSISRKFNDFRDYAPYSKAEIFLPYCGWCALPSHIIGRSVTVKYFTDIIAATCKAVVFCNNNVVAEAAGVIGLDIPFAAENVGAKMEAINAGLLATAAGGVQLAAGVGSMVSTKSTAGLKGAASGLSQYISGYTQMSMACNENWTEISGKNGDGCALAGATNIIIKVTRPKYGSSSTPPYVPAGYAHNVGYVSNKEITLGSAQGLVICDNADTSGISGATDAERAEIKRVLETGIYVNSPPE